MDQVSTPLGVQEVRWADKRCFAQKSDREVQCQTIPSGRAEQVQKDSERALQKDQKSGSGWAIQGRANSDAQAPASCRWQQRRGTGSQTRAQDLVRSESVIKKQMVSLRFMGSATAGDVVDLQSRWFLFEFAPFRLSWCSYGMQFRPKHED
mmetsp:Transcript_18670/g.29103  ORF Transcript_18670/g.29103 Transcript_18670/m.29103 type:complete len:151 (-) Transcript_18670:969-1421(-)